MPPSTTSPSAKPARADLSQARWPDSRRRAWARRALVGGLLLFLVGFVILSARSLPAVVAERLTDVSAFGGLALALFVRALTFWIWVALGLLLFAAILLRGIGRQPKVASSQ